jgi:exopolysaccharide biosynthesis polyprenyl glycosylphosphotransferase
MDVLDHHSATAAPAPSTTTSQNSAPFPVRQDSGSGQMNGHAMSNGHARHYVNGMNGGSNGLSMHAGRPAPGSGSAAAATLVPLEARAESLYLRFGKRAFDVVGAVIALIVTAPLMLLISIAIKLESNGPVLYRSTRIGRGGRPFTFLKLRSMVHGADRHRQHLNHLNEADGPVFKISRDPRVTRVGRLLRVLSIDEIPQFLNVLRGEMSLVGPRPPIPEEVRQYEPWQLRRLDVRPGITCLWQISGRSRIGFQEWMRLDLEYIRNQSFTLDLKILLRTIPAVLSREGAY